MKWFIAFCLVSSIATAAPDKPMDSLADAYIRLNLAMTPHDASFVDAYYGPADIQVTEKFTEKFMGTKVVIQTLMFSFTFDS